MIKYEKQLNEILTILNDNDILKDIIIIGSWCEFFYKYINENFNPFLRTFDLDLYIPRPRFVKEKSSIIKSFKLKYYRIDSDILTNKSIIESLDGFQLEFLSKLNRNFTPTIEIGNTNLYAASLPYLDVYDYNYIELNYYGKIIKVASPPCYVLQKLLINSERISTYKKEKDISSIKNVLNIIDSSVAYQNELNSIFNDLPNKWKKKIISTLKHYSIKLKYLKY